MVPVGVLGVTVGILGVTVGGGCVGSAGEPHDLLDQRALLRTQERPCMLSIPSHTPELGTRHK